MYCACGCGDGSQWHGCTISWSQATALEKPTGCVYTQLTSIYVSHMSYGQNFYGFTWFPDLPPLSFEHLDPDPILHLLLGASFSPEY